MRRRSGDDANSTPSMLDDDASAMRRVFGWALDIVERRYRVYPEAVKGFLSEIDRGRILADIGNTRGVGYP